MRRLPWLAMFFCIVGCLLFIAAQNKLGQLARPRENAEIRVVLPLFAQVAMTGGDRYLAANWASIRALVTETMHMQQDEYRILGQVQRDASWLNPAHEDNYYIAAAILPWERELDSAQVILRRATTARFYDYQPPFYYAFNLLHFRNDSVAAADWLQQAALRLPNPDERLVMQNYAARWLDRSDDLELAARMVEAMAKQTKRKDFAAYLRLRSERLRNLMQLRSAARQYTAIYGTAPAKIDDLVRGRLIAKHPEDPLGQGFGIDSHGVPTFLNESGK